MTAHHPALATASTWSAFRRLVLVATFAARTYCRYRLAAQVSRIRRKSAPMRWARQHRKTAHAAYRLAIRLRGLPIKLCQFLGARPDLLPSEVVTAFSSLQDRVPPRPFSELEPTLRRELGSAWEQRFAWVDRKPLASASIAQVHRARLLDGRDVAVKIQYSDVARLVASDFRVLDVIVRACRYLESNVELEVLVSEAKASVLRELDFSVEAESAMRIADVLAHRTDVIVPAVVHEHSTARVLVTEYVAGVRADDRDALVAQGLDPSRVAALLLDVFCEQIVVHGLFHADPHPGNILVRPDGRLVLLDFGVIKELDPSFRLAIATLAGAMLSEDRTGVVHGLRALGFRTRTGSDEGLDSIAKFLVRWGRGAGGACVGSETLGELWRELASARRTDPLVRAPRDLVLVGRVIEMLSGIGRTLGVDVDLAATLTPHLWTGIARAA